MTRVWIVAVLVALGGPSVAQPITIEAEDGFVHLRCVDLFGTASCEFLTANRDGFLNCVAMGADDQPLAVSVGLAASGSVAFADLAASSIARVICRR